MIPFILEAAEMTDHKKEITDLLTKYKSILIDDLLSNKSVLNLLVEETIIDKNDYEFLLQSEASESENELNDKKCEYLIDIISKDGLKCFKKFCYTIESDCKMLITALINDNLNYGKCLAQSICRLFARLYWRQIIAMQTSFPRDNERPRHEKEREQSLDC